MIFTYTMSPNSESSLAKNLQNLVKKICVKSRMEPIGSVSGNWQYFILLQPSSLETKWTNSWDLCFLKLKFGIERKLIFCSKYLFLFSKNMKYLIRPIFYIIFPNIARIVECPNSSQIIANIFAHSTNYVQPFATEMCTVLCSAEKQIYLLCTYWLMVFYLVVDKCLLSPSNTYHHS